MNFPFLETSRAALQHVPRFALDRESRGGRRQLLLGRGRPAAIIRADSPEQVAPALARLEQALGEGLHAAGFLSYELGYVLEPVLAALLPGKRQVPLLWFALFERLEPADENELADYLGVSEFHGGSGQGGEAALSQWRAQWDEAQYLARFAQVKALIAAGDIYQANLSFRLFFRHSGPPAALYLRLRQRQPVAFGGYLDTGEMTILSLSPELFFEIDGEVIRTRPMKGTFRRGRDKAQDRAFAERLARDPKNRAENLMILDLMRNDLARICRPGSVRVGGLFQVEAYPTLLQMTSHVEGRLRSGLQLEEILRALFPAGSITGAPKIRAMQVIRELEAGPRGLYCGAFGVFGRDRRSGRLAARFNVAIRSLTLFAGGRGEAGVGSGVVQDSNGAEEYAECLLKARFMQT